MIRILLFFAYITTFIIYKNILWFVVKKYYDIKNYNDEKAILKANSLIAFSYAITELNQRGYKLKYDDLMLFNKNKYRAILIKQKTII